MKKKILMFCTVALLLVLTGCGTKVKLKDGKEVVASLKDKEITAEELFDALKEKYGSNVLVELIDNYIVDTEIKDDKEIESKAKAQLSSMKEYYNQYGTDWSEVLGYYGFKNDDEFLKSMINNLKKETIIKKYLKEETSDDEINEYYEKEIYGDYTVKHILVTVNTNVEDTEKAKEDALNRAKEAINKLNDGASWGDIVKEYSDDTQTKDGDGLLPSFTKGDYVDSFFNATIALEDGEYTKEPVESTYGYHIIYRVSVSEKPSLEDSKEKVLEGIATNKLANDDKLATNKWIDIREKYDLSIADSTIESAYKKSLNA